MATDSPRACTSCAAPAEARQRWCLECGAELPQPRRGALRPAVGIATTLAVLVGAASAGGYSILRHDRQPPPSATTIAQQAPPSIPATTSPSIGSAPSYGATPPAASSASPTTLPSLPAEPGTTGGATSATHATRTTRTTPTRTTTTPATHSGGAVTEGGQTPTTTTAQKPQMAYVNIALGAAAVAYAPYAPPTMDLGDPSQVVDGTTRTAWRTPSFADPATKPQLGVYVDLATSQQLRRLVIETPTPGMGVEIYAATKGPPAAITDPRWDHLATRRSLARKATIGLPSRAYRYVLVWVTGLPPGAHNAAISEIALLSLQPE
jgi:hypothetical protein